LFFAVHFDTLAVFASKLCRWFERQILSKFAAIFW